MGEDRGLNGFIDGLVGGAVGGALVSLGLMKIARTTITSNKAVIQRQPINAGATATLLPATAYKFAIVLFHGDGDPQVQLTIRVGATTYTLRGDEQAIEVVAGETVEITAINTDTESPRNTMTIEVASLSW
jgi:FtsP/CotA-like multicopper oxidase with cupredoxin domain